MLDPDDPDTLRFPASDAYAGADWDVWDVFPQNASTEDGSYSAREHTSRLLCRDEAPFTDPERLAEAQAIPVFGPTLGRHGDLDACEVWDVEPAPPAANQPVHSDVPFLVLAGALDTVSSPAWADAFADGLDRRTSFISQASVHSPRADTRRRRRTAPSSSARHSSPTRTRSSTTPASQQRTARHSRFRSDRTDQLLLAARQTSLVPTPTLHGRGGPRAHRAHGRGVCGWNGQVALGVHRAVSGLEGRTVILPLQ